MLLVAIWGVSLLSKNVAASKPEEFFVSKRVKMLTEDKTEGRHAFKAESVTTMRWGKRETTEFKVFFQYKGSRISPWHEIPMIAGEEDGEKLLHFVCEIPKGTTAKFEINKEYENNPIIQDTKKGELRYYKYNPEAGSIVNYGAIPQTWEDPKAVHPDTGVGGDNDPIDVVQLNDEPCQVGQVQVVRLLGVFALIDGDETDWKLIVVKRNSVQTNDWKDVEDIPEERLSEIREWFRNYKTAEGKGKNRFALDEKMMPKEYAWKVTWETHDLWKKLLKDRSPNHGDEL
eukprot:gnl/MRDRNA2_/MRDRNA2_42560_c0_seq1.p1 gnl/MRDRNA2_/MRDRNA2_42560_c0~~gnl/MRDRNA2_/MRDRNA2_42560_c0_seq1.p1  ORF type:complete len:287 (+),score=71.71 gnl/MRDRNA2_/MRDRNA2_42560_c0_seq1:67-927(+)